MEPLQLGLIVSVGIFFNGEFLFVRLVAGIDAHFFYVFDRFHRRRRQEMNICHQGHVREARRRKLGANVAQASRGRYIGRRDSNDFATDFGQRDGLPNRRGDVLRVAGSHRLQANRLISAYAEIAHHDADGSAAKRMRTGCAVRHNRKSINNRQGLASAGRPAT